MVVQVNAEVNIEALPSQDLKYCALINFSEDFQMKMSSIRVFLILLMVFITIFSSADLLKGISK